MDLQLLDQYVQQTQRFTSDTPFIEMIDAHLVKTGSTEPLQSFFLGEKAFYSGSYETALKHYLDAKTIPNHGFFCYRTSAYVSEARGEAERTISFARKALQSHPSDLPTLAVLHRSLVHTGQWEEASKIETIIHQLQASFEETPQELFLEEEFENPPETVLTTRPAVTSLLDQPYHQHPLRQGDAPLAGPTAPLHSDDPEGTSLEKQIRKFQTHQTQRLQDYLLKGTQRSHLTSPTLTLLNGAKHKPLSQQLTERSRKSDTGLLLRWEGRGIVINPGRHFLTHFHAQGFHIRDIDYVIVTRDHPDCYADIQEIYELNGQLNQLGEPFHHIQYFLNQRTFQQISGLLKPLFKQEKTMVKALELYMDSTDVEQVELFPGAHLTYFATHSAGLVKSSALGIRLNLAQPNQGTHLYIGYLSGVSWSPHLAQHLGSCHVLVAGFGNTCSEDLNKKTFIDEGLGFNGTLTLMEETHPQLVLCTEFGGREGDIRLETVAQLRQTMRENHQTSPYILPGDNGLQINLEGYRVRCSLTQTEVDPKFIRVAKTDEVFGPLLYLSTRCYV